VGAAVIALVATALGAADGVTKTTAGVGVDVAAGDGDADAPSFDGFGFGDGVDVSSASGVLVGFSVGIGVIDGTELGTLNPRVEFPPEKCAMRPPSSNPAKITMITSGKSGIPPPPLLLRPVSS
jgi:hypothetical protein